MSVCAIDFQSPNVILLFGPAPNATLWFHRLGTYLGHGTKYSTMVWPSTNYNTIAWSGTKCDTMIWGQLPFIILSFG